MVADEHLPYPSGLRQLPPGPITPLWVIGAFISLTEVSAAIAAVKTSGSIQLLFAAFVVLFAFLVAGAFFAILWARNYVFYPPTDYGRETDPASFVAAMRHQPIQRAGDADLFAVIQSTVRSSLTSAELVQQLVHALPSSSPETRHAQETEVAKALSSAADRAVEQIREKAFIRLYVTGYAVKHWRDTIPPIHMWTTIPYEPYAASVHEFLWRVVLELYATFGARADRIGFFGDFFKQYGRTWVLRSERQNKKGLTGNTFEELTFHDMGPAWAEKHGHPRDDRPLKEVGVLPGMSLHVVDPADM